MKNKVLVISILFVVLSASVAFAGETNSADPFSVWEYSNNPGSWSMFPDTVVFGSKVTSSISDLSSITRDGIPFDILFGMPGLAYKYSNNLTSQAHRLILSSDGDGILGTGFSFNWEKDFATQQALFSMDYGCLLHFGSYVSMSLGVKDLFDAKNDGYFLDYGLAIRPLAFNKKLESMLSIGTDVQYDFTSNKFKFETVNARLNFDTGLSIAACVNPLDLSFGISLSTAISGMELHTATELNNANDSDNNLSAGLAIRVGDSVKFNNRYFGKTTLVIDGQDKQLTYADHPYRNVLETSEFDNNNMWFGMAIKTIEKATSDKNIDSIAIIEPPYFSSMADGQAFYRALKKFKDAGKKLFVYSTNMNSGSYIFIAAMADKVVMDPNGMFLLTDLGSMQIYLKDTLAKLGISVTNYQSHETKTAYNMYSENKMTDAERKMYTRFVTLMSEQFSSTLNEARAGKLKKDAKTAISEGPYFNPQRAVEAGLIDELAYVDEFTEMLTKEGKQQMPFLYYAREKNLSWGSPYLKNIVVVYLSGNIIVGEGQAGQSIGESTTKFLDDLANNPLVAGVILRVNSGGGSVLTSDHIARKVKALSDKGIPVYVSMGNMAASGGYYISAYADKIFAEKATMTGSIGVISVSFDIAKALEKMGTGVDSVVGSENALFGNGLTPPSEREKEIFSEGVKYSYDRFVKIVAEGRNMDEAKVDELARGQVWLGQEALENGLIDEIGGLEETKAQMRKDLGKDYNCVDYVPGQLTSDYLNEYLNSIAGKNNYVELPDFVIDAAKKYQDMKAMGEGPLYFEPSTIEF